MLTAYHIGLRESIDVARTMTFAVLAFSQMTLIFSIRSGNENAFTTLFSNGLLWGAILLVVVLMLGVMLIPALQSIFHVVSLTGTQWLWVGGLSLAAFVVSEIVKLFVRK